MAACNPMKVHTIFYVADQAKAASFYSHVLGATPVLDVTGMTEFAISEEAVLGLMPESGIRRLLGDRLPGFHGSPVTARAELYLVVEDPGACHSRALEAGARELSGLELRDWGDHVAYSIDPDGYVLAFASRAER